MSGRLSSTLLGVLVIVTQTVMAADRAVPVVKPPTEISYPVPQAAEARIRQSLGEQTEVKFSDTPLTEGVKFIGELHQFNIIVDVAALQDEGIDPSTPLNLELAGITLRSAFALMLKPLQLTYVIRDDVLQITTVASASEQVETRVYPVRDLADDGAELDALVDVIRAGSDRNGWEQDLSKTITGLARARCLVIRQTQQVHEEITALLRDLRAVQSE